MAGKKFIFPILFLILSGQVESATLIEKSYEYVVNFGKSIAPSLMSIWECMGEDEAWSCAKEKAGKILDGFGEQVEHERRNWQEAADAEVSSSGRSFDELPSKIGEEVEKSLATLAQAFHHGVARALQSRKHDSGGIDSITISTGGDKKKMKKKKQKPAKIHLLHPVMMPLRKAPKEEKGRSFPNGRQSWVIGAAQDTEGLGREKERDDEIRVEVTGVERKKGLDGMGEAGNVGGLKGPTRQARGLLTDIWSVGSDALDVMADSALEAENKENEIQDKSSLQEQRGKKKKKKKAILKLLILGAVLKAKIGTLLQILSFKLQVKFFIVAVLGLAINLARLWIDLKNKHQHQPQKVIYYEHAQHQHHYDHEDEHETHGWGPWSRSMEPEETDVDVDVDLQNSPYRGQVRNPHYTQPIA